VTPIIFGIHLQNYLSWRL